MIDPDAESPNPVPQSEIQERLISPKEAVETSNRDVITAIYEAAQEPLPDYLVQETNGSHAYLESAGLIRLVYAGEQEEARNNPYGQLENPATAKLAELIEAGAVSHTRLLDTHNGFKPENDPLYEELDKAWPTIFAFTEIASGKVLCYSIKADAYDGAPTVLVSPEHIDISSSGAESIGATAVTKTAVLQ